MPAAEAGLSVGAETKRAGGRQAATLIALGTLPTLAIASLVPVLPALFARFKDAPHMELLVPMVLTVPSLCVALFSSVIGAAADRWGRRRILLSSLVVYGLFGTAPMLFDDLHAIIASRFLVGIAEAAILTIGNALMGDYFDGEARKRWLGLQMSLGPFAASGYILAGGALGNASWRGPFLLYLMGFVVLIPATLYLFEPETGRKGSGPAAAGSSAFPWRPTFLIGGVTLFISVIFFVQAVQHGRIFSDLGVTTPSRIGMIVTLASAGTVIGGLTYRGMRLRAVGWMLAVVFASYGVGYLGVSLAPGYISGALFDSIGQFGGGFALPVLIAWSLSKYDFEHRGRGMGVFGACFFAGQFLSPPVLTLISGGHRPFLACVGIIGDISLVAAVVSWLLGQRKPGPAAAAPAPGTS